MAWTAKKVVLISFYDRVCLSTRTLSSLLKAAGHDPHLVYFKDDRAAVIETVDMDGRYFQYVFNNNYYGCGEDVNPPTETELQLLYDQITELRPDVVGISARSPAKELSRRIVTELRKRLPTARYIGGGYGPTVEPDYFLQFLDVVCLGEADAVISDLVGRDDPTRVGNAAWLADGELMCNPLSDITPLDDLPFPDWEFGQKHLVEDNAIVPLEKAYDTKTYDIFASKGCPSSCTYCQACQWPRMYRHYGGHIPKIRLRTPQSVIDELAYARERFGIEYVRFMDSIFGWNKKWLFEFLDLYDRHIGVDFFCNTDVRYVDEERIQRLAQSRLHVTQIGIQSVDERNRHEIMGRTITDRMIRDYAETLVRNHITIQYDIIHWSPFDSDRTLSQGVSFLRTLPKSDEVVVYQLKLLPGSFLHDRYVRERPAYLPPKTYEFWAWIYTMILRSPETDALVDMALSNPRYREQPGLLKTWCADTLNGRNVREKMFAARTIQKGEQIRSMMLRRAGTDLTEGVSFEDREKVAGRIAKKTIAKGEILRWEDLYTSYQKK
jgi:anaerobic magnesium-protoporphyrin IX monomethyl ester cyclase